MIEFEPLLTAIGAGILYSLYWYVNKVADPTVPTTWKDIDPYPLIATAVTGAIVGGIMAISNIDVTQVSFELQFFAYGGLVAVIERTLKTLVRIVKNRGT